MEGLSKLAYVPSALAGVNKMILECLYMMSSKSNRHSVCHRSFTLDVKILVVHYSAQNVLTWIQRVSL